MQNNHATKIFYLNSSMFLKIIYQIYAVLYIYMVQASSYDSELCAYNVNCKLLYKIIISFSNLTHTLYLRTIYTTFTINAEHLALPQILGGATILWTKLILELLNNQNFTFSIYTLKAYVIFLDIIYIKNYTRNELFRCQYWCK